MTYRQGSDWCMLTPIKVDLNLVKSLSSDKKYRCPSCNRRVNMKQYNYEPYGTALSPVWYWPPHKLRKTKR